LAVKYYTIAARNFSAIHFYAKGSSKRSCVNDWRSVALQQEQAIFS